jgi:hypothetical protein
MEEDYVAGQFPGEKTLFWPKGILRRQFQRKLDLSRQRRLFLVVLWPVIAFSLCLALTTIVNRARDPHLPMRMLSVLVLGPPLVVLLGGLIERWRIERFLHQVQAYLAGERAAAPANPRIDPHPR